MNSLQTLPIHELYQIHHRINDEEKNTRIEYPVIKKYVGSQSKLIRKSSDKIKTKKNLKLRTYLDQEEKKHRNIPGPGKYNIQSNWKVPEQKISKARDRITFLDEIIQKVKKNKSPSPGQHQKIQESRSKSFSRLDPKKEKPKQRIFYYDQYQYQASKLPGPGQYEVNSQRNSSLRKNKASPEQHFRKFRMRSQIKLKKSSKKLDMGTYDPEESNFFTFRAASKVKPDNKSFGIGVRFKTESMGSGLSPNKYELINEWRGKQSKKKTYQKQGLDVLSKLQSRIYN